MPLGVDSIKDAVISASNNVSKGFESLTIDETIGGVALTQDKYNTYSKALITVEKAPIRFTTDGTPPTSTIGHLLNAGDILKLESHEDIAAFRAIRTTSVSGVIQVTYSDVD